jgi:outer membrane receptor for ferric coprogen and ferric-rhodotorulic acid
MRKMDGRRRGKVAAAVLIPGLLLTIGMTSAHAEETTSSTLDEVVVTGLREARSSQGATGLALDIKNTPQSIVQLDRSMLDTFALDSVNSALRYVNGVSVESVETERTNYFVRGFDIRQMQVDGVMMVTGEDYVGSFDTALFEKIEVIRGANGLLTGIGAPSGTINYIRKRPLNDRRATLKATADRWGTRRIDADFSTPLTESGTWALRVVGADSDEETWIDRYTNDRQVAYIVTDGQLSEDAVLTLGASYQNSKSSNPLWGALPTVYSDGTQTNWDRSASHSMNWAFWDTETKSAFAELLYQLPGNWKLKLVTNFANRVEDSETIWYDGRPDRNTGLGMTGWPGSYPGDSDVYFGDLSLSGQVNLFGREHSVLVGVSHNREQAKYWTRNVPESHPVWGPTPPFFGTWNGTEIPRPAFGPRELTSDYDSDLTRLYAVAQWKLSDAVSLLTGLHYFDVAKSGVAWSAPVDEGESKASPYVGAVWSATDTLNVYASYSDIFRPQNELNEQAQFLGPSKGENFEIGVKKTWLNGKLLSALALYQAEQSNYAEWAGSDDVTGLSWSRGVNIETQGIEIDIDGRVSDLWTLQAGYTFLDLKNAGNGDERTYLPAHTVTLLNELKVPAVEGLRVAASLRWQDEIHYTSGNTGTRVRQSAYALLGVSATYDFNDHLAVTLNLDNVTDETYLNSLYWADIYTWDQAYYGEPRNATLRVSYAW